MPTTTPPEVALREFLNSSTRHIRRCEIYEADGITRWSKDTEVRLKEGTVSVDANRDERRTVELLLNNSDGVLVNAPQEFWYDKIIKVFRGVQINQPPRDPRILIISDKTGEGTLASSFRDALVTSGFGDVLVNTTAYEWSDVLNFDIIVALGGAVESQVDVLAFAYRNGKSVYVQDVDSKKFITELVPTASSFFQSSQRIAPVAGSPHPASKAWQAWNTMLPFTRKNFARNPRFAGAPVGDNVPSAASYIKGTGEDGVTMTSDAPSQVLLRTNYLVNPSFEVDAAGWSGFQCSISRSGTTRPERVGSFSGAVSVTDSPTGSSYVATASAAGAPVVEGQWAAVSLLASRSTGATHARLSMQFVDSANVAISTVHGPITALRGSNFDRFVTAGQAPANAARVRLLFYVCGNASGGAAPNGNTLIDAGMMVVGPSEADVRDGASVYFDGSIGPVDIPGDVRYVHGWTSTAHNSYSTRSLTITPGGKGPNGVSSFARRVVTKAKESGSSGWQGVNASYRGLLSGVKDESATVSVWLRYVGPTPIRVRLRAILYATGGTVGPGQTDTTFVDLPSGAWIRLAMTQKALADFETMGWWTYLIGGTPPAQDQTLPAGSVLDISAVLMEKTPDLLDYFDPFIPDDWYTAVWDGAVNASTSTLVMKAGEAFDPNEIPNSTSLSNVDGAEQYSRILALQEPIRGGRAIVASIPFDFNQYDVPQVVNMLASFFAWLNTVRPLLSWECQVGEFMIDRISEKHFPHDVSLTGRDYTKKCMSSKFLYATQFASGMALESIVASIAGAAGITKRSLPVTGVVVGREFFFDRGVSRWEAMKEIAGAYDYEIFFDATGFLILRPYSDPVSTSPVLMLKTGREGQLASFEKSTSDSRIYNVVLVTGESSDTATPPVYAVARNDDPNSPTSTVNIGERVYEYSSSFIETTEQAQQVANSFLAVHALEEFELNFSSLMLPWLEAGDIIGFQDPSPAPGDPNTFLLSNFNIPLGLGPMDGGARRVTNVS